MCGIAGIHAYRDAADPVDRAELLTIREAMAARGPDGAGAWVADDARTGLAHRRLAVIDLSADAAQPMASADGRLRIACNGEIYNHRELRAGLEARGSVFRTRSDTEVLLHLYAERGPAMVDLLRGMFAFAIWDARCRQLFVARDPLGVKPLYYADDGGTFRFASQVGALVAGGRIDAAEDPAGIAGFHLLGHVPEPFTFHRGVRALPAGSMLTVGRDGVRGPVAYFDVAEAFRAAEAAPVTLAPGALDERIRATLREAVRAHVVADVPVGIFLSSGADSGVLATLAAEAGAAKPAAVTVGFAEYRRTRDDETALAERLACVLGLDHATRWFARAEFAAAAPRFLAAMDQASIDGANGYLAAQAAAERGLKVALSGLGGDELFGGYPSFRDVPRLRRLPAGRAPGRALRALAGPLLARWASPKYAGLLEYGGSWGGAYLLRRALRMPWELPRIMGRERARAGLDALRIVERLEASVRGLENPRCAVAALELQWYMRNQLLRDADWAGMAHGVEVRVPFVDVAVLRALAPLVAGANPPTKAHLARAIAAPVGEAIAARRKTGFSVPVRDWLAAGRPRSARERGLRGWADVVGRHKQGRRFLSFVTEAYGGHGGIALYNRDLLQALTSFPGCARVIAIPRHVPNPPGPLPRGLDYATAGAGGKLRYFAATMRTVRRECTPDRRPDLVVCGHIHLLPLAWLASRRLGAPLVLFIYGIDAWQPTRSLVANALARHAPHIVAISEVTARRFRSWVRPVERELRVLPNAIHTDWYAPGPKSAALLARYGLEGRAVLMTLGRLMAGERYKGCDEVLDALPELLRAVPDLAYLIVGDGDDRERLARKARDLGVAARVVFAGAITDAEKVDHYRLADAFVMASRGEGFGFVLLEALACGIPVIASKTDGGREAVRDGQLGILVDPGDRAELVRAVREALARPRGAVPAGLEHFAFPRFEARAHALFGQVLSQAPQPFGSG